jgi:hypothetical protein
VIVTVHENSAHSLSVAAERMGCVAAGCLVAITVTFVFDRLLHQKQPSAH